MTLRIIVPASHGIKKQPSDLGCNRL